MIGTNHPSRPLAGNGAGGADAPSAPARPPRRATRRSLLFGAAGAAIAARETWPVLAGSRPAVRLGILQFGTVQWIANVIRRHDLDARNDFTLQTVTLANTSAGRVALMARAADIVVSDWMFAATQRAAGTPLKFAPFSSATGGLMVPAGSPVRSFADLAHKKLGVAGGPTDKSWLIARAAAEKTTGTDLQSAAQIVYAAPPLLNAKLMQGELTAALTFWNFAARLETQGCREVISVDDCARALGLPREPPLVGFVFREDWAERQEAAINGLLRAAAEAETILSQSDQEWERIRPLMQAKDDALFQNLRRRFRAGVSHVTAEQEQQSAARLFDVLLRTGGPAATGGLKQLPDGIFWQKPYG